MTNILADELLSKFTNSQNEFEALVDDIKEIIDKVQSTDFKLLPEDKKIEADFLVLYAINSLYFMNLRINHQDSNFVKTELKRVQEAMNKFKQTKDKLTIMPRLDKDASKRFVRNAMWTPPKADKGPVNKKIRFDDDGNAIEPTKS